MSHRALKSVQSFLLLATTRKKRKKAYIVYKKSQKRYISRIHGEAPCEQILANFCTSGDMPTSVQILVWKNEGFGI